MKTLYPAGQFNHFYEDLLDLSTCILSWDRSGGCQFGKKANLSMIHLDQSVL